MSKVFDPTKSDLRRQSTVLICGDILTHRKLFSRSSLIAHGVPVVRCSEDQDTIAIWMRLDPTLFFARQGFIEELANTDLMKLTDYGKLAYVQAILDQDTPEAVTKLLRIGCRGVLPFRFSFMLFRRAVLKMLDGEIWAHGSIEANLLAGLRRANAGKQRTLSPRQEQILELISLGHKNPAIAEALFISLETVRWHTRRLYRKIGRRLRVPQLQPTGDRTVAASG